MSRVGRTPPGGPGDWKQLRLRAEAFLCSWDPKAYHQKEKAVRKSLAMYESVAKKNSEGEKEYDSAVRHARSALQNAKERMNEMTLFARWRRVRD